MSVIRVYANTFLVKKKINQANEDPIKLVEGTEALSEIFKTLKEGRYKGSVLPPGVFACWFYASAMHAPFPEAPKSPKKTP